MERVLAVMPTGSGKAPTLTTFIKEALDQWPDTRILSLVHTKELVSQNLKTMLRIWPDAPVSVYSAGLKMRDMSGQIVFGSIQSLYNKAYDLQKVDLIIVDEAHLIPASGDGMYRKLMGELGKINGGQVPMAGFTATPFRLQSGSLVEGDGRVFDDIVYEVPLLDLIERGYLCPLVTKRTSTALDGQGVKQRGGEFVESALQDAIDREELTRSAVAEIVDKGRDRLSWLVFSTGVKHAHHIRDELRTHGISAEVVHGETPHHERDAFIQAHKSGALRCLVNDSVLTTGFDNPRVDLLAVLRPTMSAGLWVQMCGRGTRLSPETGKTECLVLDFGGNAMRHGPLDQIQGAVKGAVKASAAPQKTCPNCESIVPAAVTVCPDCDWEFEIVRERKAHAAEADAAPLLSNQASDWLTVTRIAYNAHRKPGKPTTLRCDYYCGLVKYSEWVCLAHPIDSYPRSVAWRWWEGRSLYNHFKDSASEAPPTDIDYALELINEYRQMGYWREPTHIRIRPDGQYWRIASVKFGDR